jgi:hypothetical protein
MTKTILVSLAFRLGYFFGGDLENHHFVEWQVGLDPENVSASHPDGPKIFNDTADYFVATKLQRHMAAHRKTQLGLCGFHRSRASHQGAVPVACLT